MSEKWKRYGFEYDFEGTTYIFDIPAASPAEAKRRIAKIAMSRYIGEPVMTVPAPVGIVVPLICWVRNTLRSLFGATR
jgi:hypothetical protein